VKKYTNLILFLLLCVNIHAQERGGLVVNKYRHTPLLLNIYANALYGNATSSQISSAVSAAYSVRRLNLYYSGPLIKISNAGNTTTYDIGYNANNDLDVTYLSSVIGATSWYVVKWYDQSGNGRDIIPTSNTTVYMPRFVNAGVLDKKGANNRPAVTFQSTTNEFKYATNTSVQIVNAVRDLVGNSYQYLVSMPIDQDFAVRAGGGFTSTGGGGYSDGPNVNDWWSGGSMYVNGAAISGSSTGAVSPLHTLTSYASSVKTGTFSVSSSFMSRGMYNGDGVCELILFPNSTDMTVANRTIIQGNQKSYFGTP